MPIIAQIIVDVPLMQTDKPFSYIVPDDLVDQISLGSRVHVPFGRGNRLLQGFVVGFSEVLENASADLKEVVEVLDFEPVLNEEQLLLAEQLRHTVFSYKISILKSMIPSLLNSQYDKLLLPTKKLTEQEHQTIFGGKERQLFSNLTTEQQRQLGRLVQTGKITVDYLAKDKKNVKTEKWYRPNLSALSVSEITTRAKKRLALRDYLLNHQEDGKLSDLYQLFSREVVKFFIDNELLIITEREVSRSEDYFEVETTAFLSLNEEQSAVVERVTSQIGQKSKPFLLEGITGSGKTEVYLHIIDRVLKMGKTAIVLVPEISLTPQMTNRFISRFGKQVAIMHSEIGRAHV